MFKKKVNAYNLQELLVVLVIIGILILIAMPSFMGVINKAKSIEAQQSLKTIQSLQKSHFYLNEHYHYSHIPLANSSGETFIVGNYYYDYITKKIPKPMIKFGGIPFLKYLINYYSRYNFENIYILSGYKHKFICNYFKKIF